MARLFGGIQSPVLKPPAYVCRNWPEDQRISFMQSTLQPEKFSPSIRTAMLMMSAAFPYLDDEASDELVEYDRSGVRVSGDV